MGKRIKSLLAVAVLLLMAGCGQGAGPGHDTGGASKSSPPVEVQQDDSSRATSSSGQAGTPAGAESPSITEAGKTGEQKQEQEQEPGAGDKTGSVIKTDNEVAGQEAGQMLEEVDRQLDDLLKALDGAEDIDEKDLQYEGGQ